MAAARIAAAPEQVDHLAEDPYPRLATLRAAALDGLAEDGVEPLGVRVVADHEAQQRVLSVQHRQQTGGDGLLDPAAVAPQQLREGQAVRLGSDDQYRLAGCQARAGEMCDRVEEEPFVLIELHDVIAGRGFGEERIAPGRRFRERGLGGSFGGVNQMQACYFVRHGVSEERVSALVTG